MTEVIIALCVGILTIILGRLIESLYAKQKIKSKTVKELLSVIIRYAVPSGLIAYSYFLFTFNKTYVLFIAINLFVILLNIIIVLFNEMDDKLKKLPFK